MSLLRILLAIISIFITSSARAAQNAGKILKDSGIKGGLVVNIGFPSTGSGQGALDKLINSAKNGPYLFHVLEKDESNVLKAREYLHKKGLYGKVQVERFDGKTLPYVDNLVNLIVIKDAGYKIRDEEIDRVLAPNGVSVIDDKKVVKRWPEKIKNWTHYLNDAGGNAVSEDEEAGYPLHMRWAASPLWARHHDKQASISALVTDEGRLYYIVDRGPVHTPTHDAQWMLEARDAFNGLLLWSRPMGGWVSPQWGFRSGPVQLARLLVAEKENVFATMGFNEAVSVINGKTGETVRELKVTKMAEEMVYHDGVLLVIVGNKVVEHSLRPRRKVQGDKNDSKKANYREKALVAVDPGSGKLLWRYPKEGFADITPRTLAAADSKVVLQNLGETICLDLSDGETSWAKTVFAKSEPVKDLAEEKKKDNKQGKKKGKRKGGNGKMRLPGWGFNTMVVHDGVVLTARNNQMFALSLDDGNELWKSSVATPFGHVPEIDVLVIDGLVWTSPDLEQGRDIHTGKVKARLDKSEIVTVGHHHRCYRNKGLGDNIIYGYRGLEYLNTKGNEHQRNNWLRGLCQYGVMPANGVVYVPSHNCGCYPEAMLRGFWAVAEKQKGVSVPKNFAGKLYKGSSYSKTINRSVGWTAYMGGAGRKSVADKSVSTSPTKAWETELGGSLTAPVSAAGVVLVVNKDAHTVYALDEATGSEKWKYIVGSTVDSPPTIHKGAALFGCADGCVYSLSLKDGSLRWRFDAAPAYIKSVSFGSVESLWPVKGSVMIKNDIAYFTAGRNSYLDEGLFLYGLDAMSGEVKYTTRVLGDHPGATKNEKNVKKETFVQNASDYKTLESPDKSDAFSMEGNIGDMMLADSDSVYLRHMRFNDKLERENEFKHHLFSTSTFVDDNEAHRSHFFFGNGNFSNLPVAYEWITRNKYGGYNVPSAKYMVYEDKMLWGATHDKSGGYSIFAFNIEGLDDRYDKNFPGEEGKFGGRRDWEMKMTIRPRTMLKAGGNILIAGAEQVDQLLGADGGGILMMISAETGEDVASMKLDSVPVFNGMSSSGGKLYISLQNGSVVCYK